MNDAVGPWWPFARRPWPGSVPESEWTRLPLTSTELAGTSALQRSWIHRSRLDNWPRARRLGVPWRERCSVITRTVGASTERVPARRLRRPATADGAELCRGRSGIRRLKRSLSRYGTSAEADDIMTTSPSSQATRLATLGGVLMGREGRDRHSTSSPSRQDELSSGQESEGSGWTRPWPRPVLSRVCRSVRGALPRATHLVFGLVVCASSGAPVGGSHRSAIPGLSRGIRIRTRASDGGGRRREL